MSILNGRRSVQGKVVVVTGASAGVGRAAAREFAHRGASVAVFARGPERLDAVVREIEAAGGRALQVAVDVSDADAVESAAERVERELGEIDVWVNAAMSAVLAEVKDTAPEEFRRVTEVTYLGSVYGVMAALRRMLPRDRGTIVQVGSALARRGIPLQASYCGAKHGLQGFLDSLRAELLHHGSSVRVTMVQLPGLNTPQFGWVRTRLRRHPQPVPPIYQPEVAGRAIVWATEHPRREYWVGAPTVKTIAGNTLAPGLVDRYLARTNFDAQQTDLPIDPEERVDNLFAPPPGDPGAHGRFDDQARGSSAQWWVRRHRGTLALGGAAVAAAAAAAVLQDR
ncbi:MAG TPA: SDR family oxidoreductase [Thermoleophilaceae bacterium]|jgi:NAD(P)-dependent dehydrogenase (short-subunit alcohol dehydrogenase family)